MPNNDPPASALSGQAKGAQGASNLITEQSQRTISYVPLGGGPSQARTFPNEANQNAWIAMNWFWLAEVSQGR